MYNYYTCYLKEIQQNTALVFENNSVADLSEEALFAILSLDFMNLPSELILFKAVEEWLDCNMNGKHIISYISFNEGVNIWK